MTKQKKLSINMGIDFGTCYSKVCFEESHKKLFVKYYSNESVYKHSKVYYDYVNKIFYYQKPEYLNSIETIKYFKYSMIDKSLPRSIKIPVSNPKTTYEILCGIFFIACLIKHSKKYIEKHYKRHGVLQFEWNITIGVPIDNYSNEFRALYDMILQGAIKLSEKLNKYSISMDILDNFCQENLKNTIPSFKASPNNTLSELYAESLSFLQDDNVLEGLYTIVDIGGATVDMAVIHKALEKNIMLSMDNNTKQKKYKYCIFAKSIQPLGIEILKHKIAKNTDSYSSIRKLLLVNGFKNTDIDYNKSEEKKFVSKMQEAFARLAKEVRDKRIAREALINQKGKLRVILCGGGARYKWYKDCISSTWDRILNTLEDVGFRLEFISIENLKRYYNNIDHRLIISSGLAQDIQSIPDLDGFPWDYSGITYSEINQNEFLEETMKEKYGKNL